MLNALRKVTAFVQRRRNAPAEMENQPSVAPRDACAVIGPYAFRRLVSLRGAPSPFN